MIYIRKHWQDWVLRWTKEVLEYGIHMQMGKRQGTKSFGTIIDQITYRLYIK